MESIISENRIPFSVRRGNEMIMYTVIICVMIVAISTVLLIAEADTHYTYKFDESGIIHEFYHGEATNVCMMAVPSLKYIIYFECEELGTIVDTVEGGK